MQLTIDRDIQFIAERAIRAKVNESAADSGTVVVMDPRTGEVLALATYPSFDPRDPTSAPEADRGNRALTEIYEPGSTSKVMTMAAALDAGAVKPSTPIEVPPILCRGGDVLLTTTPTTAPALTATGVLAQSSNMGTMLIAERLGDRPLYSYLRKFGMGSTSGLDIPWRERRAAAGCRRLGPNQRRDHRLRPGAVAQCGAVDVGLRHYRQQRGSGRTNPRGRFHRPGRNVRSGSCTRPESGGTARNGQDAAPDDGERGLGAGNCSHGADPWVSGGG